MMNCWKSVRCFDWNDDHLSNETSAGSPGTKVRTLLITRPCHSDYTWNPQLHILIPDAGSRVANRRNLQNRIQLLQLLKSNTIIIFISKRHSPVSRIIIYIIGVKLILFNDGSVDYKGYQSASWKTDFPQKRKSISSTYICKHVILNLYLFQLYISSSVTVSTATLPSKYF